MKLHKLKSITGRLLKQRFEYLKKTYWRINGIWSDGYFVSIIGLNENIIRKYIENQYKEDIDQAELAIDLNKEIDCKPRDLPRGCLLLRSSQRKIFL